MAKQVVFIVTTDKDGKAEAQGYCDHAGPLDGPVRSIQYITDNRLPFDAGVSFQFSGADSGAAVLTVADVDGRATWEPSGAVLNNEPIKVIVTGGGKGRSGSFVVTCS